MGKRLDPATVIAETDAMQAERSVFASAWQDVRDFICPLAQAMIGSETPGSSSGEKVLDNTAESASDLLAAALVSMETPETDEMFELRTDDEKVNADRDCAVWLEEVARRMHIAFRSPRGGFHAHQHQKKMDGVNFGTAGGYIAPRPGRGIVFTSVPLQQLLLDEDSDGFVNKVHRDFPLEARRAAERWGNLLPAKILECAGDAKKANTKFRFIHAVCPRRERDYQSAKNTDMTFASTYIACEDKSIIQDTGFHEMPYQTPRWVKRGDEKYGRSPGMKALRDVKSLQRTTRITYRGAEKRIDPPLLVVDDGVLSPVRTNSSGLTHVRSGAWQQDPVRPLNTGGDPGLGEEVMVSIRSRIDNVFLKPLIQMLRTDRMTATEVLQVVEEQQRMIGPYLGRQKSEDLGPMIERVFSVMYRAGAFPPMPEKLQDRDLVIEYVAPAIRVQRVGKARALSQFEQIVGPMVERNMALADNMDEDLVFRGVGDALGLPKLWFREPTQVIKMRDARQQAQQQAQAQQQMLDGAGAAANVVKALPALRQAMDGGGEQRAA